MTSSPLSTIDGKAPDWATRAFYRFAEQSERLGAVIRLSAEGISGLTALPELINALAHRNRNDNSKNYEARLSAARKNAELAEREIRDDFPILYSVATVAIWSYLEAMLRTTIVSWLRNDPESFKIELIAKLRVRLGEYEQMSQDDRFNYVAELLEAELAAGIRNGVERFESMLKPFRLDGEVPEKMRRDLFEFGQVRNAIVHRGAHADRQLVGACPWLGLSVGSELNLNRASFSVYLTAAHEYVILLLCRVCERFGENMAESRKSVLDRYNAA